MKLRRMLTVAVVAGAALAVPAVAASAACTTGTYSPTSGDTSTGVCVSELGYVAAGTNSSGQAYVVASNDELGYAGLSNYGSAGGATQCNTVTQDGENEGGSGANSGGCYGGDGTVVNLGALAAVIPLPVCGDDTGSFENSTRDGCRNDGVDDGLDFLNDVLCLAGVVSCDG